MDVDSLAENRKSLLHFLDAEVDSLTAILRVYLRRAGLPGDEDSLGELLNSVVVEALAHAQRFDPARPPRPWLLGIGANLVRRKQAELGRLNQREPLAGDLAGSGPAELDEDQLFERLEATALAAANRPDLQSEIEQRDGLAAALNLLSSGERKVIELFVERGLNGDALAAALRLKPGAARVRLHRALAHLRRVWRFTEEKTSHD